MFLRIANPGIANPEALITLGMSTTRYSDKAGLVGQFGSGTKFSISLLLRNHLQPIIYIGNLQMHFNVRTVECDRQIFHKVVVKYGGKDEFGKNRSNTEDSGFTTEWGALDWDDLTMAPREFVANAIDGCIRNGYSTKDVEIEFVAKPRAKNGWTQVFIPLHEEITKFYIELSKRFLHFRNDESLQLALLPKIDKNIVRIYKKGVLVCKLNANSIYDYNVGDELKLDESRNAHEWNVRYAVASTIAKNATPQQLEQLVKQMVIDPNIWENKLERDYMCGKYVLNTEGCIKVAEKWKGAWKTVFGENAVACNNVKGLDDFVRRKGYSPITVTNEMLSLTEVFGISNQNAVLSGMEKMGRTTNSASEAMKDAVQRVWTTLGTYGLLNGKEKPDVMGFAEIMQAEAQCFGEYDVATHTIYIHNDLSGNLLLKVALEEVVHAASGAADNSRDIQDYLFNLIVKVCLT